MTAPLPTSDDAAFRRAMADAPRDSAPPLVYADWLEEQGRAGEAQDLRGRWAPEWSEDQARAMERVAAWRSGGLWRGGDHGQRFTLAGLAGTGKSTILSHLAGEWGPGVAVCCLAGKAAHVLRQKGVEQATTIHSLIYHREETARGVRWVRRMELEADVVVVDEGSMLSTVIVRDLESFGVPVFYVGDHGQLPPIGDDPGLLRRPDVRLEKIHRQAEGNPILRLAHAIREGRWHQVPKGWADREGRLRLADARDWQAEADQAADQGWQVVCARNRTRHALNHRIRRRKGFGGPLPCPGELLICLENNPQYKVFNGQQSRCLECKPGKWGGVDLTVEGEDGTPTEMPAVPEQFGADSLRGQFPRGLALWDWGWAITAHKAQGSQFDGVLVVEEPLGPDWATTRHRWGYTAATRARERLVYCV